MRRGRSIIVGATAAALIALPGLAAASSGAPADTGVAAAASLVHQHHTAIRFLDFAHIEGAGLTTHIRGQVVSSSRGQRGAVAGLTVTLYRQLDGETRWASLGTAKTGAGDYPQFNFPTAATQNAHYKVVFAGTELFAPSQAVTWVTVFRHFNALITDGKNSATLHGAVDPYYTHKSITLLRRSCPTCAYVTYRTATTGVAGAYSFSLPAPSTGRWWWRLSTPGTGAFIPSFSGTFSTQRVD